ncbi:MAG: hypothetical protein ACR2QC_00985, partial [Gammaproteobacteria bacterium]
MRVLAASFCAVLGASATAQLGDEVLDDVILTDAGVGQLTASNGLIQGSTFSLLIPGVNGVDFTNYAYQWYHCPKDPTENPGPSGIVLSNCVVGYERFADVQVPPGDAFPPSAFTGALDGLALYVLNARTPKARPWIVATATPKAGGTAAGGQTFVAAMLGRRDSFARLPSKIKATDSRIAPDNYLSAAYPGGAEAVNPYECFIARTAEACGDEYPHGIEVYGIDWLVLNLSGSAGFLLSGFERSGVQDSLQFNADDRWTRDLAADDRLGFGFFLGRLYDDRAAREITDDGRLVLFNGRLDGNAGVRVQFTVSFADTFTTLPHGEGEVGQASFFRDLDSPPSNLPLAKVPLRAGNGLLKGSALSPAFDFDGADYTNLLYDRFTGVNDETFVSAADENGNPVTADDFDILWYHCPDSVFAPHPTNPVGSFPLDTDLRSSLENCVPGDGAPDGAGTEYSLQNKPPASLPRILAVAAPNREGIDNAYYANYRGLFTLHPIMGVNPHNSLIAANSQIAAVGGLTGFDVLECQQQATVDACGTTYPHGLQSFEIEWVLESVFIATQQNGTQSVRPALPGDQFDFLRKVTPKSLGLDFRLGEVYDEDKAFSVDENGAGAYFAALRQNGEEVSLAISLRVEFVDSFGESVVGGGEAGPFPVSFSPVIEWNAAARQFTVVSPSSTQEGIEAVGVNWICTDAAGKWSGGSTADFTRGRVLDINHEFLRDRYTSDTLTGGDLDFCSHIAAILDFGAGIGASNLPEPVSGFHSNRLRFVGPDLRHSHDSLSVRLRHTGDGYTEGDVYHIEATFLDPLGDIITLNSAAQPEVFQRIFVLPGGTGTAGEIYGGRNFGAVPWIKSTADINVSGRNFNIDHTVQIACRADGSTCPLIERQASFGYTYTLRHDHFVDSFRTLADGRTVFLDNFYVRLYDGGATRVDDVDNFDGISWVRGGLPRNAPIEGEYNIFVQRLDADGGLLPAAPVNFADEALFRIANRQGFSIDRLGLLDRNDNPAVVAEPTPFNPSPIPGLGVARRTWQTKINDGEWVDLGRSFNADYRPRGDDFAGAQPGDQLQIRAHFVATDEWGFENDLFTSPLSHTDRPPSDDLLITIAGVNAGDLASVVLTGVTDPDGAVLPFSYQWQAGDEGGEWTDIPGATGETYALNSDDFDGKVHLRYRAVLTDPFFGLASLISPSARIRGKPLGAATVSLIGEIYSGAATVSLLTAGISISEESPEFNLNFARAIWFEDGAITATTDGNFYILPFRNNENAELAA